MSTRNRNFLTFVTVSGSMSNINITRFGGITMGTLVNDLSTVTNHGQVLCAEA